MFRSLFYKRRIKKIWKLHEPLRALYGDHKDYTIGQISKVATQARLSPKHHHFAHALFATRLCFDNEYKGKYNYWDLRREFQTIIFGHFTYITSKEAITSDFKKRAKKYNSQSSKSGSSSAGAF